MPDQHIVLFHQRDRVIFQVMQRHQFRANDVANFSAAISV
jgi:hypothetical protein